VVDFQAIALQKHDKISQTALDRIITKDNIALCVLLKPNFRVGPHAGKIPILL
jgi:hypothetical protein